MMEQRTIAWKPSYIEGYLTWAGFAWAEKRPKQISAGYENSTLTMLLEMTPSKLEVEESQPTPPPSILSLIYPTTCRASTSSWEPLKRRISTTSRINYACLESNGTQQARIQGPSAARVSCPRPNSGTLL
ncbi:hypothetical protein V6N12_028908 [Hibiscus sabdariffa]|uniref:Uncharacterized protein n=1 Tax=Hibiscus sabdariffa TaxID=183260 RepID=A0ABR2F790_9ROSI